jgi:hypothetical protein
MWITLLDMSTKYQGEPMQISWNLCLIQIKFIKIEIQGDSMYFKSTFFSWYFKCSRLVNHKDEEQKFRNLRKFRAL